MPKRLVCQQHNTVSWEEFELPEKLAPDRIRVRNTHGAEKHGTMAAFVHGYGNKRGHWDESRGMFMPGGVTWPYPIPLGNMQVGIVEKTGSDVRTCQEGDRILYFGGFASVSVIGSEDIWKLRADTRWKAATCLDPATYAFCALRDGNVRLGDSVAIFSLGAIGIMAVQLAKIAGCHPIIAIDPLANRRNLALKIGADHAIDPINSDVGARLRELTDGRGVDEVIEYSGAMEALQASLRGVAFGGNVVFGGFPGPMKAGLDLGAEAHMNRPNLIFSRNESDPNRDHPRWDKPRIRAVVYRMILEGQLNAEELISPVVKFSDNLPSEYERITASPDTSIKLGVEY